MRIKSLLMLKEKFRESIRLRFLVVISLILFLSTLAMSTMIVLNERRMLKHALTTKGQGLALYLAKISSDHLIMKNRIQLDFFANEANKDEDTVYTVIKNSQDKILTTQYASINYQQPRIKAILSGLSKDSELQDIITVLNKTEHVIEFSAPVMSGANIIGSVTIAMSEHKIRQQTVNTILFVLMLNALGAFVLGIVLFVFSEKTIFNPISKLADAISHLAKRELSTRVNVKTKGEVQMLVDSFNRMAEALEKTTVSKDYIDNIIGSMIDTLIVISPRGNIVRANTAACTLLGYEERELLGQPIEMIFDKKDTLNLDNLAAQESLSNIETFYTTKNGQKIPVLFSASAMHDSEHVIQAIVCMAQDITKHKALEAQLLQAQKMETVGTFAGGIAHDFNNILTAIIGYAHLLSMQMKDDDPLKHNISQILVSAERAANLTRELLAFSRKQIVALNPVNINELVNKSSDILTRLIGDDIELKKMLIDKKLIILGDASYIEQVLMNLATNARDAMPHGGLLTISTDLVKVDYEYVNVHGYGKAGTYALISVTDTGTGIDEKTRPRIFEPFFTTKETGKGTGLGLSTVYGIVKQHNGYINCYSEIGRGTTFKIYLPLIQSEAYVETKLPKDIPAGTKTVLIADDSEEIREFVSSILTKAGYRTITATDGEEAIKKFTENKNEIQLLFLDVVMPKKNGREVYEETKLINPDIKVLFTSGYTATIIHKKGIIEKELNFIPKPILPQELLKKVKEILDTK